MTDKKKQTEAGATELSEEDLEKAQGGAKYDGVDGEALKKKALPGTAFIERLDKNKDGNT